MLYKSVRIKPQEIKADITANTLCAYAAHFNNRDSGGDIIMPGAFAKTLQENASRVKVLLQHDFYSPIGKPLVMREDNTGLYTESKIVPTALGKDTLLLISEGVIDEMSIGYDTIIDSYDREADVKHLLELRLWEYSPVTWAMNDLARIVGLKDAASINPLMVKVAAFQEEIKAGRVLSARNIELLQSAYSAIGELLAATEEDGKQKQTPDNTTSDKSDDTPDNPHVHADILDALSDAKKTLHEMTVLAELHKFGKSLSIH
jgi:HK97 family phage prohead protease